MPLDIYIMSQTALELQHQMVARWRQMDAQNRYTTKKRRREEDDATSKTPSAAGANEARLRVHETPTTPSPHQNT